MDLVGAARIEAVIRAAIAVLGAVIIDGATLDAADPFTATAVATLSLVPALLVPPLTPSLLRTPGQAILRFSALASSVSSGTIAPPNPRTVRPPSSLRRDPPEPTARASRSNAVPSIYVLPPQDVSTCNDKSKPAKRNTIRGYGKIWKAVWTNQRSGATGAHQVVPWHCLCVITASVMPGADVKDGSL
jgi:hypothetical protein